jgi:hypothetical protein
VRKFNLNFFLKNKKKSINCDLLIIMNNTERVMTQILKCCKHDGVQNRIWITSCRQHEIQTRIINFVQINEIRS